MNRPRPNRVSICAGAAPRPWRLSQTAAALFLLLVAPAMPAAAQATGGGPAPPNTGPDYLPSLPQSGFGVPSPIQAPSAASPNPAPGPEQAPSLRLPPPGAGVTPLQQNQPAAPAILIQPRASVGETLTDNVFNTATDRVADLETQLIPGLSISADTPRLQGVLTGQLEYDKYLRETEEDQLFGNLYANGTVTAIEDHLFLDAKSDLTQTPELGAAGFAPISQLPKSQLSQVFTNYVSPYFRESYGHGKLVLGHSVLARPGAAGVLRHPEVVEEQPWVPVELADFLGDVGDASGLDQADGETPQTGDVFGAVSGADAAAVFVVDPVEDVMACIFDGPVSAVDLEDAFGVGLLR